MKQHDRDDLMKLEIPPISRTTLALYAGASGDHNPIHIDLDVARSAGLEDVFAHGMLSMGYLARLLTDLVPQERIRSYGVRFTAVTPVHARPTCTAVRGRVEDGLTHLDLTMTLDDGTVTLQGQAIIEGEL
ncbi:acyl dehydratase [Streptosporangium becharense]|uniref:Acyl dehydratase n=1 Tax=Streptosporangium becharense TaxID=1816182 RepID=A0A7W9IJ71_9ACTN|nr:MaoC/PaaZ C-terminal domain-containing protein [Streptosporangium becharense]MBB2911240.1 acyl dehydratase [Streptosporangium becharense]MBB5821702.1 acyl dehydratase [Streptosporangium becharense]